MLWWLQTAVCAALHYVLSLLGALRQSACWLRLHGTVSHVYLLLLGHLPADWEKAVERRQGSQQGSCSLGFCSVSEVVCCPFRCGYNYHDHHQYNCRAKAAWLVRLWRQASQTACQDCPLIMPYSQAQGHIIAAARTPCEMLLGHCHVTQTQISK